jgi:Na+(H+)/acetate symporter ActP
LSAGAFLGLTALVFANGHDGLIYAIGYTTGLPIVVFLMAGRMRRLGKYTFITPGSSTIVNGRIWRRPAGFPQDFA